MSQSPGDIRKKTKLIGHGGPHDVVLTELCSALFASLPRSDQRRKGVEYVRGLLGAEGRKSIRNIAALLGGQATEQSLHHFISDSTWDWAPVRLALAQHLAHIAPPQAWVVRPMVIPKAGEHSVGVGRRFCPDLGQALNAQQAVGVWAASEDISVPINWRLHLSQAWLDDDDRRNRALIPDEVDLETVGDCAVEAYLGTAARRELPTRPVVLDAREMDVAGTVRKLRAAGAPMLIRISSTQRLTVADPNLPGHSTDALPAHQITGAARDMRRPVTGPRFGTGGGRWTSLAATVRVKAPGDTGGRGELLLLSAGDIGQSWPTELWLTDLTSADPGSLLRMGRLIHRVDHDFTQIADQVGVRDFAGRSFTGWHRHITLASAAHAVAALSDTGGRELSRVS
jgi:DDE superfamily endonuclease